MVLLRYPNNSNTRQILAQWKEIRTPSRDVLRYFLGLTLRLAMPKNTQQSYKSLPLERPAFPNITDIKNASLQNLTFPQGLFKQLRWFKYIFFGEHPRTPMHAQSTLAPRLRKDIDTIERICVNRAHDIPRSVRANRNQTEIEWPSELPNLLESRTARQILVLRTVIILLVWQFRYFPVPSIPAAIRQNSKSISRVLYSPSKIHLLPSTLDTPARPQATSLVERRPRRHMLARQTPDHRDNVVFPFGRALRVSNNSFGPMRLRPRQP